MMDNTKYVAKSLNFDVTTIKRVKSLGIKNFTDFVRSAVADKIRDMELQSLKEHYKSSEMEEVMTDFDCTSEDGL